MSHGPNNTAFFICGTLLLLICLLKLPALVRRRHDMLLRAVVMLLFAAAGVFYLAAPDSLAEINRITGVANFAAPVVYSVIIANAGASLLLIINWRPAPPDRTRRASRICITAYGLVIVAIFALFCAGDAPVEQLTLFDGYYAGTPYIREMILTYLVAQGVATMTTSVLCWRWSTKVEGSLRIGLRILAPAYLLHVCYDIVKLIAIFAHWAGRNLDFLIDQVAPQFAAPSALLAVVGFSLPLAEPRVTQAVRALRQLHELAPLWRELKDVPAPGAIPASLSWWSFPAVRLTGRKTAIKDALLALTPYLDRSIREEAYQTAVQAGENECFAATAADAAMIVVASRRQNRTTLTVDDSADTPPWRSQDLIPLSRALTSPVVARFGQIHGAPTESSSL
ncbi:MAB_1171c family putative transporter [Streptomyces sp. NPDC001443]